MSRLFALIVLVSAALVNCHPLHELQISIGHPLHAATQPNLDDVTDLHAKAPLYLRLRRDVPVSSYSYNRIDEEVTTETFLTTVPPIEVTTSSEISSDPANPVLKLDQDADLNGSFSYSFEAADGTSVELKSIPKTMSDGTVVVRIEGEYTFTPPDGTNIRRTRWSVDESGFHVNETHLPV